MSALYSGEYDDIMDKYSSKQRMYKKRAKTDYIQKIQICY